DIRKTLMDKELGSKLTYFETLQLLVEQQEELSVQKSHLHAAEAAVAAIRETRGQTVAEYRRTLSDELAKAEQKANGLTHDLIKAEQKTRLPELDGPLVPMPVGARRTSFGLGEHWGSGSWQTTRWRPFLTGSWSGVAARGRSHGRRSGCFSVTTAPINAPA